MQDSPFYQTPKCYALHTPLQGVLSIWWGRGYLDPCNTGTWFLGSTQVLIQTSSRSVWDTVQTMHKCQWCRLVTIMPLSVYQCLWCCRHNLATAIVYHIYLMTTVFVNIAHSY